MFKELKERKKDRIRVCVCIGAPWFSDSCLAIAEDPLRKGVATGSQANQVYRSSRARSLARLPNN